MKNYSGKKTIWHTVLLLFAASFMQAQTRTLSLQEAIDSALKNNRGILLAVADEKIAAAKFKETDAIYLPQAEASFTGVTTNNSLNAFGFKLQQQIVSQADFNPILLNKPGNTADFTGKLQIKQPIFNPDLVYLRKAAAKQVESYRSGTQRTAEYVMYEVQKAYMQLQLAYDAVAGMEDALRTANAMYVFTNNRVQEGLMQKSDALNVKVWISTVETSLAGAKSNVLNASDYISLLMGTSYGIVYKCLPSTDSVMLSAATTVPVNRADFTAMTKAIEAANLVINSSKKSFLPKLNGFASYQFNDNRLLGFGADSYLAGLQLTWDIFRGNSTKNKIAIQTTERNKLATQLQSQLEQSQLELNKTIRQYADAQYNISQQKAAVANAAEALRILQDRYEQGLVNSTDVLMAQSQLSQQKLGLAQAMFNKNSTAAYINFLTAQSK